MKKFFPIATLFVCAIVLATSGISSAGSCSDESGILRRLEVESVLEDVALIHSLDPALLSAMARVESGGCSDAVSPIGAAGLMQLMPTTASEFGVGDRFDPVENALGAARFIDYLRRDRPDGKLSLPEIVAAYNAGEGAVTHAHGVPHYHETQAYVRRVLWLYLIGHVPELESARDSRLGPSPQSKHAPRASRTAHRYAPGSDGAILQQLADVQRARVQAAPATTPAPQ